jgi:hypothetical protein
MIGKIGVSTEPKKRVRGQGYIAYDILETHTCIYKVSDREIELQKEYGYKVDKILYWKSIENRKKAEKVLRESGYYDTFGKNQPTQKICVALDINTNKLIKEFSSLSEAARWVEKEHNSHIRRCCEGKRVSAYGYRWQYKNEENNYTIREKIHFNPNPPKSVIVFRKDGSFIGEFNSQHECARQLNIDQRGISKVCSGKLKSTNGFVIKYKF